MPGRAGVEELVIRPPGSEWRRLVGVVGERRPDSRFRQQAGLPPEGPIVMTGHQAAFWHPGILAKYIGADAAAGLAGGAAAWLVVDQDRPAADSFVAYPVVHEDGAATREVWDVASGSPPPRSPVESVHRGLERIARAWRAHQGEASAAGRVAGAVADLMAPLVRRAPMVMATGLSRTELFAGLVERMRRDPGACCRAYNAAAAERPRAGVRPLLVDEVQFVYELPLWRVRPGMARERVYAEMLDGVTARELAPRALLTTAVVRLGGCDLFIHGTGGGEYDRVTERWLELWLGAELPELGGLAPVAIVSATLLLPLSHAPIPTPAEVARARWLAHHARHQPGVVGDGASQEAKERLVARIAESKRDGRAAPAFREMHALLGAYRARHAADLAGLEERARGAERRRGSADVLLDRTWAFPLYPKGTLEELRGAIAGELGAGR